MGKVRFGLENVYYALHKAPSDDGVDVTFDAPKRVPGAVKMSINPEGGSSTFYADNGAYETFETNSGYTGELEIAALEDAAAADLLGELKDNVGGMYETSDAQPSPFVLLFEIKGNKAPQRFALYNCKVSRPTREANTTAEETNPDTVTLSFTAIPLAMTLDKEVKNVTKYTLELSEQNKTQFNAFFTAVPKPVPTPSM